ncbi:hypothetical protein [Roseateles sp.]|uniref:hypothetical protein n=1 Tax=Roseateles sp. TaxID=1971397 RepID=UPI003D1426F1
MGIARNIAKQWARWIISGLVAALLFMQLAVAAYACPKLEAPSHDSTMQMAVMPDCHAMPGSMDEEAPQLCHAHCSSDSQSAPSVHAPDFQAVAAQAVWLAYVLPAVLDAAMPTERRAAHAEPTPGRGFPPLYLTLQVLRN